LLEGYQKTRRFPKNARSSLATVFLELNKALTLVGLFPLMISRHMCLTIVLCAERVAVDVSQVHPIPKGMTYDQAAGLFITWPTSYEGIVGRGETKPGELGEHNH
jgi:hypothetical protein